MWCFCDVSVTVFQMYITFYWASFRLYLKMDLINNLLKIIVLDFSLIKSYMHLKNGLPPIVKAGSSGT